MVVKRLAVLAAILGVVPAFGAVDIYSDSLGPGLGSGNGWSASGGSETNYSYYAGIMYWNYGTTTGSPQFGSVCADMVGVFSEHTTFPVDEIHPVESSYVAAANIFGEYYLDAKSDSSGIRGAALQLAVWNALGYTVTFDGTASADLLTDYTTYSGGNASGDSQYVTYLKPTTTYGQGQFVYSREYKPGPPTPEPITIGLGAAALGLAALRRRRRA